MGNPGHITVFSGSCPIHNGTLETFTGNPGRITFFSGSCSIHNGTLETFMQ